MYSSCKPLNIYINKTLLFVLNTKSLNIRNINYAIINYDIKLNIIITWYIFFELFQNKFDIGVFSIVFIS